MNAGRICRKCVQMLPVLLSLIYTRFENFCSIGGYFKMMNE